MIDNKAGIPGLEFAQIATAAEKWRIIDAPSRFESVARDWPMVVYEIKKQTEA